MLLKRVHVAVVLQRVNVPFLSAVQPPVLGKEIRNAGGPFIQSTRSYKMKYTTKHWNPKWKKLRALKVV